MEILTRERCEKCAGEGFVDTELGARFKAANKRQKELTGEYMSRQGVDNWCAYNGVRNLYPMTEACSECDTTGYLQTWIASEKLVDLLKTFES